MLLISPLGSTASEENELILMAQLPFQQIFTSSDESQVRILDYPWDHSPITVYIDNKSVPEHYSPTYHEQIEKALEYWEEGGNGNLKYKPVFKLVDSEEADIKIMWVENLETIQGAPSGVAGYAIPTMTHGKFGRVNIVLEVGNYKGKAWRQYGDATMLVIAKHELGHALGLDHSNDKEDIMYPEYEMRDNIDPILLNKYGPLLRTALYGAVAIIVFLSVSWLLSRKKRKELEDEYFK